MIIKFTRKNDSAIPFKYSREGDACLDVYSSEEYIIQPYSVQLVETGIAVEIPKGYEGIIRGRSGLAKQGLLVHVGTIDSNYRGTIGVLMYNSNSYEFYIHKDTRIAQFTVKPIIEVCLLEAKELTPSNRGDNGYGSSGLY